MKDFLSTTFVPAIVESWRQHAETKMQPEMCRSRIEVRLLTPSERESWKSRFAGKSDLPWFAAIFEDEVMLIADKLSALIKELKDAGYSVYDLSDLA